VVRRNDEGEAQRRRWTFYEAIKSYFKITEAGCIEPAGKKKKGGER